MSSKVKKPKIEEVEKKIRSAVRVVVRSENEEGKILLIRRVKADEEYLVLPGGTVEKKESEESAAIREIKEETNLNIKIDKILGSVENIEGKTTVFLAKKIMGNYTLKLGGPEKKKASEEDKYIFEWVPITQLENIDLKPDEVASLLVKNKAHLS